MSLNLSKLLRLSCGQSLSTLRKSSAIVASSQRITETYFDATTFDLRQEFLPKVTHQAICPANGVEDTTLYVSPFARILIPFSRLVTLYVCERRLSECAFVCAVLKLAPVSSCNLLHCDHMLHLTPLPSRIDGYPGLCLELDFCIGSCLFLS